MVDLHCDCTQVIVHALELGKSFTHSSHTKREASISKITVKKKKNDGICSKWIANKTKCDTFFLYVSMSALNVGASRYTTKTDLFFFQSLERFPHRKIQLKYEVNHILCNESASAGSDKWELLQQQRVVIDVPN